MAADGVGTFTGWIQNPAAQTVSELIGFLAKGPTPKQVASYKVSQRSQQRPRRLLALNQSSLLSEEEQAELEETETLEHIVTMLKIQASEQSAGKEK